MESMDERDNNSLSHIPLLTINISHLELFEIITIGFFFFLKERVVKKIYETSYNNILLKRI